MNGGIIMERLACLVHERNEISEEIAGIIGRPALNGHIGEFIASKIFRIKLEASATSKGIDGFFIEGSLKGKSVNVKLYGKKENIMDISAGTIADYYLVLAGEDGDLSSSKGKTRPLIISQVFLFNMRKLMPVLRERGVRIGIATSVRKKDWNEAMIYPVQRNREIVIGDESIKLLQLFDNPSASGYAGFPFVKVCDINPVRDESNAVYEYKPYLRYENRKGLNMHSYGHGPFCSFKIPSENNGLNGVYLLKVDRKVVYVGKTEDLGVRFNQGYGNISPRNCFKGGQQTNCRVNNLILEKTKNGSLVELLFHKTSDLETVESSLILTLKPQWNKTTPKALQNKSGYSGKYRTIGDYLSGLTSDSITITFNELEKILGFSLPNSAHNYPAWWANSGHNHCGAWRDYSWLVDGVSPGEWIRFRKEEP